MMGVLDIIHSFYAVVGVTANLLLLSIICLTKSSGLKTYAIIVANVACVDIIEILLDLFEVPRMVAYGEDSILLFHGLCTKFGPEICYRCHLVMLHLIFHSLFLIAYSFWYRYRILKKAAPPWYIVQTIIIILFIPNGTPMLLAMFARDDQEGSKNILRTVYPTVDVNNLTHRSVNLFDPFSAPTDYSAIFGPFIVYTFIVVMRRKVLRTLASLSGKMSVRTKQMHESLVKVLTYHAALPSTICIGVSSFFFQMMGFHSSHIDGLIFIFACIPAVVNPFLSLYFVAPYRRYRCKERKFEL
ncbi:hypothetical protein PRIPAC_80392 [Pristionchus pacificus]|uniref:G protein-coupled receptor n=1 Tax=Pristionchus pacificus TaxID=54126 RepID=A0A2A6C487_PRIPA|nr:hypothetical protein PRIPAC_80392 [Pristionchus pacificus]|eukprot:PDM72974.1 G protein-coupled receptor [Pristionchus pacificus]